MTFRDSEINQIEIDMNTLWLYDEEQQRVVVDFYPGYSIRRRVLDFLGLDLDNVFTDMWLDATAMIDPERRIVTGLYFEVPLDEYNGMPPTELSLSITNYPEGKLFFDRLMETSNGGLEEFIKEYDDASPKLKHHTLDPILYKTNILGEFGTGKAYERK